MVRCVVWSECVCLCVCAPFQLSQEACWWGQFKLELLKGPWHRCHQVRVFFRLIRSCSAFGTLVFFVPLPSPLLPVQQAPPVSAPQQLPGIQPHSHFKSGQHSFTTWPGRPLQSVSLKDSLISESPTWCQLFHIRAKARLWFRLITNRWT